MPAQHPWLDTRLDLDERLDSLLGEMTLDEQIGQLHQSANLDASVADDRTLLLAGGVGSTLLASGATAGNVRDAGITRARVDALQRAAAESRLGIPLLIGRDVVHGHRTVFPIPLGLAAAFDEELAERIGERSAAEAIADGITWAFSPMLDLVDDPRWGRVAESLGESATLTSRLGAALVRGLQSSGHLAATAKHFVGYGLSRGGRDYARVDVGERMLRGAHLRPFRAAVDAGVGTVMVGFSDVDGIPLHAHRGLVRGVLKDEWGFDGVVVADWNGIGELVAHGVASDLRDAARQAIDAGIDVDMVSGAYATHLADLVAAGEVDRALVEDAARRVVRLKLRLGLFDAECPSLPGGGSAQGSRALGIDRELARRAAAASFVSLADDGKPVIEPTLAQVAKARRDALHGTPPGPTPGPVLLAGAYARERASLLGTWTLDGDPDDVPTVADAMTDAMTDAMRATAQGDAHAGTPPLVIDDGAFTDRTLRLAREASTVIALVGEHAIRSGEDSAASDIGLPPGQLELLRALRTVSHRLVVVVFAGRPLVLDEAASLADRLIVAWHPGTEGATALAGVLLGMPHGMPLGMPLDAVSVTGLAPMTFPRSIGQLPVSHTERPSGRPQPNDPRGLGRYLDGPAAPFAAFGSGASRLRYGSLSGPATVTRGEQLEVTLTVRNDGPSTAAEPVLLFFRDEVAEVTRPLRELLDFVRVSVPPHSTTQVRFAVPTDAFGYVGRDGRFRVDAGRITLTAGWGRPDAATLAIEVVT